MTYILVAGNPAVTELVAAAAKLGSPVTAVVVGSQAVVDAVNAPGVDAITWLGDPGAAGAEAYASQVAQLVAAAPGVVFGGRHPGERVLLGAAAAALDAPVITSASEIATDGGSTVVTHGVYGGIAVETLAFSGPVAFLLEGGAPLAGGGSAAVQQVAGAPAGVTVTGLEPPATKAANIAGAARVVGVGRGLKSADDLPLVQGLADAFQAELACSRPVAEGLEWLPKDRYVGISGTQIAPDVYLMVGISGQIQHMGGCKGAKVIVAVNSDKDAPVASEADYVLTGDLYALVPALTAALQGAS
ncbi:MAG: electron transfer flavoprotein subunit alpha/FixB family protein [Propionibacteriaceae bacterium]|nr:electron transfer flavoprotein subunit alpha/FixB family protein [Propionibacteriaceae bacterium]